MNISVEHLQENIQSYVEQYNQCTQEAQRLIQQANELQTRATRLEGAVQALQELQRNLDPVDTSPQFPPEGEE